MAAEYLETAKQHRPHLILLNINNASIYESLIDVVIFASFHVIGLIITECFMNVGMIELWSMI